MVLTAGAEQSATGVSLTALTECVHSDAASPPRRKCFLLMQDNHRKQMSQILDSPPLREFSYHTYDVDNDSNNSSELGGAVGKPPISLKQTEFSFKQFAKWMGQANYSAFNKWKKEWVAGYME